MDEFRWVRLSEPAPGIRRLELNRPPVNALGSEMVDELLAAIERLSAESATRALILGASGKQFCAGADLKERQTMTLDEVRAFVPRLVAICSGLAALPYPTLAAIRGAAAGGGCEIALGCDLRILSDRARIGLRETALSIIPGAGGTQRLPRLIGPSRAKRWIFSARMFEAAEALRDGVADEVAADENLDSRALELAREMAANGPLANRLAKRSIDAGADLPLSRALDLEWELYQKTLGSADRVEALRAFAEKRPPRFEGR